MFFFVLFFFPCVFWWSDVPEECTVRGGRNLHLPCGAYPGWRRWISRLGRLLPLPTSRLHYEDLPDCLFFDHSFWGNLLTRHLTAIPVGVDRRLCSSSFSLSHQPPRGLCHHYRPVLSESFRDIPTYPPIVCPKLIVSAIYVHGNCLPALHNTNLEDSGLSSSAELLPSHPLAQIHSTLSKLLRHESNPAYSISRSPRYPQGSNAVRSFLCDLVPRSTRPFRATLLHNKATLSRDVWDGVVSWPLIHLLLIFI